MTNLIHDNDITNIIQKIKKDAKKIVKKKILLVGYNGFLGKYFLEVFNKLSHNLKFDLDCCDNFISSVKDSQREKCSFNFIHGDILKNFLFYPKNIFKIMKIIILQKKL